MKKHQRYFPVVDPSGELLPYFITVRNGSSEHLSIVRRGNEEVIRARFVDAAFFFDEDTRQPLEDFLVRLGTLTFQEQLGSMLDKSRRIERLVPHVADALGLAEEEAAVSDRAAHLCKADLATQMVIELTSLQGIMGREYALLSGEGPAVAQAVLEHYLPRGAGDRSPETKAGLAVGVADRLDSLAGLFAAGITPSGSSDPYQLRRQALGIVQNLIAHRASFSVAQGLVEAASHLPFAADDAAVADALSFFVERLRGYLRESGYAHDVVDAVITERGSDPYQALVGVQELSEWVGRPDWQRILDNYARCVRITRDVQATGQVDPSRFEQDAERALYSAYINARTEIGDQRSIEGFLTAFLPLVDLIDAYFARESGVLVMADDERLRSNRIAQLWAIAALSDGIADLSRLEGF
jgi:glycyl-tRNA synthetase